MQSLQYFAHTYTATCVYVAVTITVHMCGFERKLERITRSNNSTVSQTATIHRLARLQWGKILKLSSPEGIDANLEIQTNNNGHAC